MTAHDDPSDDPEWSLLGPGLLVAATGVGAGDLAAGLVAGSRYGLNFVWAVLIGIVLKFALNEGVGRYHLATDRTIIEGIHSLGRWASGFFGGYSLLWGFVYGAAASSSCALAANALFPAVPFWVYVVVHPIAGAVLVLANRYEVFEDIITVFISLMVVTVVGAAVFVLPQLGDIIATGLPALPEGSTIYALGLIGGTGGTITMASYGYWLSEKEWTGSRYIPVMRRDAASAYIITGIFVIALIIMSAALLYGTGASVSGEDGLLTLAANLGNQLHPALRYAFLIGFWAASFTSVLGTWHGVSYLFADFVGRFTGDIDDHAEIESELRRTPAYKFYVLWLTFPPMLLYFLGQPVFIIIVYGALGAVFMPFLAISLLVLLNSDRVNPADRNGPVFNSLLVVSALLFIALLVNELGSLLL
ncbi:Nramp family divalent metal transporter [Halococcus hamelinensis]|uniref:Metal ion transport protein n=1 Tax=Halococcus hamelinensis 100A6 TaxID=1132509 RepID=M0M6D3_9EURY|nr:Nramp family divalent metal transporter [Halococcus hamelinensis]EMA40953.1 metal ion transport protein [Halococcus hamelinensis 100A6]